MTNELNHGACPDAFIMGSGQNREETRLPMNRILNAKNTTRMCSSNVRTLFQNGRLGLVTRMSWSCVADAIDKTVRTSLEWKPDWRRRGTGRPFKTAGEDLAEMGLTLR